MSPFVALSSVLIYAVLFACCCVSINNFVPISYMDEIFHVPQAQAYCEGRLSHWDDKITTLPGLYAIAYMLLSSISTVSGVALSSELLCGVAALRLVNSLFAATTLMVVYSILRELHPRMEVADCMLKTIEVCLFPIHFFFHFLFYTDTVSTFWVLLCFLLSLRGRHIWSALTGALAVFCRQTNVVWVAFVAAGVLLRLYESGRLSGGATDIPPHVLKPSKISEVPRALFSFVSQVVRNAKALSMVVWPYIIVGVMFVVFVAVNGAIVVGHKEHHQAALHLPQVLYFSALFLLSLGCKLLHMPLWRQLLLDTRDSLRGGVGGIVVPLLAAALMAWAVAKFTYFHPFLLADNRHYTFYVFKNFFRRFAWARFVAIPVYCVGFWLMRRLSFGASSMLLFLFHIVFTAVALVPTPLVEPRYFVVPIMFLQLYEEEGRLAATSNLRTLNCVALALVNAALVYVFVAKPFTWADNTIARFLP